MPDSAAVAPVRHRPSRRALTLLTIPIVALVIMNNVGNALAPEWFDKHPLGLLALNSQNRNLILTTNQLDAWSYYLVASVRLLVADPLFFLLGYWYGDAALTWMEQRTKTFGTMLRQWEGWFGKAAYPLIFIAPNNPICLFAGAAGMSLTGFFLTNIAGTITRLYLIRRLGETFEEPINSVQDWIRDFRTPLLVASIALAVVFTLGEFRKGGPALDELEDLAEGEEPSEGTS
jgi:membrane protein DedA with SNARE-associated domain